MATKTHKLRIKVGSCKEAAMGPGLRRIPVPTVPPSVTATPKPVPKTFQSLFSIQYILTYGREVVGVFYVSQGSEIDGFPFFGKELIVDANEIGAAI